MGSPVIRMNDKVTGTCAIHQIPNPASGAPQPSPAPLPFSAPLLQGLEPTQQMGRIIKGSTKVLAGGKPLATVSGQATCCATPGSLVSTQSTVLAG